MNDDAITTMIMTDREREIARRLAELCRVGNEGQCAKLSGATSVEVGRIERRHEALSKAFREWYEANPP